MSKKLTHESSAVVHKSPGRIRLKVPKSQRHHLDKVKKNLENTPGVTNVEVNHKTGSVLVQHEHEAPIFEILHKAVETVGTDLLTTLIEGEAVSIIGPASLIAAAVGVFATALGKPRAAAAATDAEPSGNGSGFSLPSFTGEVSDLKYVVPAAFFVAAAYKTYEMGSFWVGITPIALAYWGFDIYWKLNVSKVVEPSAPQTLETAKLEATKLEAPEPSPN
jgi:copper chaperone CopZ